MLKLKLVWMKNIHIELHKKNDILKKKVSKREERK